MADTSASPPRRGAASRIPPTQSALPPGVARPADAITITRTLQSAVLRLRCTLLALKLAADNELENPQHERLFWPDLMSVLVALTPDANTLDDVVDELRRAAPKSAASATPAS